MSGAEIWNVTDHYIKIKIDILLSILYQFQNIFRLGAGAVA